jgi:hypothetical protein
MFDKIKILLVDDNPESLTLRDTVDGKQSDLPRIAAPELAPYFEVLWLATVEEVRNFRDSFLTVASASPELLGEVGVVPELLIFDYALSGIDLAVNERRAVGEHGYQKISPIPRLKTALSKLDISLRELTDSRPRLEHLEGEASKTPVAGKGADNYGCFGGGLLLTAFFGHPCASVPTTRWGEEKTEGTEAAIFEWLLKRDSDGSFQHKGRTSARWDEIIKFAIPRLRKRIEQLDDANLIRLSLDDLFELSENNPGQIQALRVWSRYGLRRLPVKILFMEMEDDETMATWAQKRLASLLTKTVPPLFSGDDFSEISALAQKLQIKADQVSKFLWEKFKKKTQNTLTVKNPVAEDQRLALVQELNDVILGTSIYDEQRFVGVSLRGETSALRDKHPIGDDLFRLNRMLLEDAYSQEIVKGQNKLSLANLTTAKREIREGKELAKTLWDIYSSDVLLRRFQLSRLAEKGSLSQDEQTAYEADRRFFGVATASNGEEEVSPEKVYTIKKNGEKIAARSLRWAILFTILNLCRRKSVAQENCHRHTGVRNASFFGPLSAEDVFLALYPSPGKTPYIAKTLSGEHAHDLTRLKTDDRPPSKNDATNFGNLGLKIENVLDGKMWSEDAPAKGQWTYGLLPGEKFVLRAYALDIGLTKSDQSPFLNAILT